MGQETQMLSGDRDDPGGHLGSEHSSTVADPVRDVVNPCGQLRQAISRPLVRYVPLAHCSQVALLDSEVSC